MGRIVMGDDNGDQGAQAKLKTQHAAESQDSGNHEPRDLAIESTVGEDTNNDSAVVSRAEKNPFVLVDMDLADIVKETDSKITPIQFVLVSLGLGLGLFLSMLDTSIVATSLFAIAVEFNELDTINWVALSYTLGYLGFAVFFTQMADIFGRRNAFVAAFVIFSGFSVGCALSRSLGQLITFRALQGIGGSGLYSITMVIFPEVTPLRMTQFIGGLCGMVIAVAGVLGPVLGGCLTHFTSWRWIFWINVPIGFTSICLFLLAWPRPGQIVEMERRSWKEADFVGSFLLIAASVLVIFAFQHAGSDPGQWDQAIFLASLLCGLISWVALFVWEWAVERWKPDMIAAWPSALLLNRVYVAGILSTIFLAFPFFTIIFTLPLRFQVVNRESVLMAGLLLLPLLGSSALGSIVGAAISNKENHVCETILCGGCLIMVGCGLLTTLSDAETLESKCLGFIVLVGLGNGLAASATTILAAVESSIRDGATGQGILAQMRILGGSFGIAASSAILSRKVASELGGALSLQQLGELQHGDISLTEAQLTIEKKIYSDAFAEDMRICTALAAVGVVCTLGTFRKVRRSILQEREALILEEMRRRKAKANAEAMIKRDEKLQALKAVR